MLIQVFVNLRNPRHVRRFVSTLADIQILPSSNKTMRLVPARCQGVMRMPYGASYFS